MPLPNEQRPDPDELLQAVSQDAAGYGRGRLKVFFGACAGVGKTYAMLRAAAQQQAEGVAVLAGVVETHRRVETQRLLEGLRILPMKKISYRDRMLDEFDLDAALESGAGLILVDELAHSNAPGSRHAKRWQDVRELLDAGIDVYTTLNVQHLDSLNDIVGSITGIRVRETVPDRIFDAAAEVILIDLPADDLLTRLQEGKVYLDEAGQRARENFFRKGNLIALRELALRRVADRINADVRSYRLTNAIRQVWPTRERLMVCVGADRSDLTLLREGARLAQHLQADWVVVHVDHPHRGRNPQERETLRELASAAQSLGAEFANLPGEDIPETLLEYARVRNATKMILGRRSPRRLLAHRNLADSIARLNREIGLILIGVNAPAHKVSGSAGHATSPQHLFSSIAWASAVCALVTLVGGGLLRVFDVSNIVMLFMLSVVLITLRLGRVAGIWSAFVCVGSLDFFFIEPRFSFTVSDTQFLFTFVLMLTITLVISQLALRLRSEARQATVGERRAAAIARVARELSAAIKTEQITAICSETIAPLFSINAVLILPSLDGELLPVGDHASVDLSVAQWSYDHAEQAGSGTQTLSAARAQYLPLKAPMRVRGVLALYPGGHPIPTDPDDKRLLDALCASVAMALERIHFVDIAQDALVKMEGERLRNALLASVSHDLKTPLTAIRGLAETLEQPEPVPREKSLPIIRAIRMQTDELQRLVTNLLDLARMQSAGVHINRQWQAVDEIIGSALAHSEHMLDGHVISIDVPADLPLIEVDALLIQRVLINLLDNAAKYSGAASHIGIRALESGQDMYIRVEDDGPGFPVSEAERLFEPFERGQKEAAVAGVGLGLALCQAIMAAHGGTIHAEPLSPRGARFEIRLPLGVPPSMDQETD